MRIPSCVLNASISKTGAGISNGIPPSLMIDFRAKFYIDSLCVSKFVYNENETTEIKINKLVKNTLDKYKTF